MSMYIGSYGHGIRLSTMDVVVDTPQPSFLALSVDGRTLYAVNEVTEGTLSAFAVGPDGGLTPLGARSTHGAQPCHVHVHGRYVLSANYGSGSVAVHPVGADGALGEATDVVQHTGSGPDPQRQAGPHAHQVRTDPAGRWVHAVDLGADRIFRYRLHDGKLGADGATELPPGSGPRHLAFHPSGTVAYLTNELGDSLSVLAYDPASGRLAHLRTVPAAPDDADGDGSGGRNYPSEVVVAHDGRTVYVANRGHDSVAVFAVDGAGGVAAEGAVPCGGHWPRHIALSRDGAFLHVANERSDRVTTLRVDDRLRPAGPPLPAGSPTMVLPV